MLIVTIDGVSHMVIKYETDLVDDFGKTSCGIDFSAWEGIQGRQPMPVLELRNGPGFPDGTVWCSDCPSCDCKKCQRA